MVSHFRAAVVGALALLSVLASGWTTSVAHAAALPLLQPLDPTYVLTLKSLNGNTKTYIDFVNESGHTVDVYWINYTGQLVLYDVLATSQTFRQLTYLTHPWIIYDETQKAYTVGFLPISQEAEALIVPPPPSAKNLGLPSPLVEPQDMPTSPANPTPPMTPAADSNRNCPSVPNAFCGNPVNAATGNKLQIETDFTGAANTGLSLKRTYNSQDTGVTPFGARWRSQWRSGLVVSGNTVTVTRSDGQQNVFTKNGAVYTATPDVRDVLSAISGGYRLVTVSDATEIFALSGQLLSVTTRSGLTTTLTYDASKKLTKVTGPFGHILSFTYDSNGRIATMTAPDGGFYTYAYDKLGNLVSVTYPDGATRRYVYENTAFPNALTGIIDEKGIRFAAWSYDSSARAISSQHAGGVDLTTVSYGMNASTVTDARGNAHSYNLLTQFNLVKPTGLTGAQVQSAGGKAFTYDAHGFIASRTDWDGNVTTYTHDARGDETSRIEASGTGLVRAISTRWHPTFHLPTQIVEPNRTTTFGYDAHGNLLRKSIAANGATRSFFYSYNAFGQVLTATDPRGNVTHYSYDARGDLASITDALGHVTRITAYDGAGRPLTIVDPNSVVTALTYDKRGRLTSRTVGALKTVYGYDKAGNLIRVAMPDGSFLAYSYDAAHRLTQIADAAGDRIVYTLDAASNRIKEQAFYPSGTLARTRSFAYDAVNRLAQSIGALGQTTAYAYDPESNLTSVADPLSHATQYHYDALNRLALGINPNGGTTFYGYDANDHLASVTDPRSLKTAYAWDGLDDQLQLASPDTGVTNRAFDAAGNVVSSTDARGKRTLYTYDALNRVTKAAYSDGTSAVWQYDLGAYGIGRLSKLTDVTGSTSYSYDANGHVTQKRQAIGAVTLTTAYGYDAGGRLARITYPSGRQAVYAYDAAGRINSVTANGQALVKAVTYVPFGMASGWTAGNGATYRRTVDLDGRIAGLALPASDTIGLSYDAASRIIGLTETGQPAETFSYDALDRLHIYASGAATQTYTYDADGNRASYATNGTSPVSLAYNVDKASNRLLGIGGTSKESFTYDATGNMLSYSAPFADYSFSYDARNRQTESFVGAIGTPWLINGLGQRVSQFAAKVPQFYFAYDEAGHLTGKYDAVGNADQQETVWLGDLPIAVLQPSGQLYIAPDHLGAPHQITNASGKVAWLWSHDSFGNGDPSDPLGNFTYDVRFPGQFHDQATHLHYNYFRDYDPRSGRYIESDPVGLKGGVNTYAYARNNSVGRTDPYGLCLEDFCITEIVTAITIVEQIVYDYCGPSGCQPSPPSPAPSLGGMCPLSSAPPLQNLKLPIIPPPLVLTLPQNGPSIGPATGPANQAVPLPEPTGPADIFENAPKFVGPFGGSIYIP
jgi:RHS repeat-associated protein